MDSTPSAVTWAALSALVVSLLAPLVLGPLLRRYGIVDVPNARSSHEKVTLRGGGLAPLLGVLVASTVVLAGRPQGLDIFAFVTVLTVGVVAALVGLADDILSLSAVLRGLVQMVLGLVAAGVLATYFSVPFWWAITAGIAIAAHINFANFMDGVNGISGMHGVVAGASLALVGWVFDSVWLGAVGVMLAVSFGAFLFWNLKPPGMFLGDVGSYLLGALSAAAVVAGAFSGLSPIALFAPFAIYWADTVSTIARRARNQESILKAHRTHVYQRLTDTGLSHIGVSLTVSGFTAVAGAAGLLEALRLISWPAALIVLAALIVVYLLLPRLRGNVLPKANRTALVDVPLPVEAPVDHDFLPKTWAVVGASGFVGSAVVTHLERRGFEVRQITAPRVEADPGIVDARQFVSIAQGHPATSELAKVLAGVDVVVNAAGLATPDGGATPSLFGANALLPAILAVAAGAAGVPRMIHASSAAVQGRRVELDESPSVSTFTPYSRSKALGERAMFAVVVDKATSTNVVTVRATSVQGPGRPTTQNLQRIARSPIASVARPGTQPTVVSSIGGLVAFIEAIGSHTGVLRPLYLQPWEGLSVTEVLTLAGGKPPRVLPRWLCLALVAVGRVAGTFVPELGGAVRRVELMWLGQRQSTGAFTGAVTQSGQSIAAVLQGETVRS